VVGLREAAKVDAFVEKLVEVEIVLKQERYCSGLFELKFRLK